MRTTLDDHERAIAGLDDTPEPPYRRTPADDRIRAIFWLVVVPMYLIGVSILGWAVGTVLWQWIGW